MDSQNTPTQRRTRQTQSQPMPTNPNQPIPTNPNQPIRYDPNFYGVIPPSAAVYDPNFYNTNFSHYGMSHGYQIPMMGQGGFTAMLTQSSPMATQSTPSPTTMPNINEPRDRVESSPEFDEVPETQPTPPSPPPPPPSGTGKKGKKGKGKANSPKDGKRKFPDREPPKKWTPDEEVALAMSWVAVSEDSVVDDFWDTVRLSFEHRMQCPPQYRTVHQIRSKCVMLGKLVQQFTNIYNNVKSQRKSGEGDNDWLTKARFRYKEEHKKAFQHEHVWDVLKDSEKYIRTPLIGATSRPKRSKTSESATPNTDASDAHGPFDVDADEEDENEEEEERPRPIGRNAARASGSASTGAASSDYVSGLFSHLTTLTTTSHEILAQKQRDLDLRERDLMFRQSESEEKKQRRDYRFYISPHAHLTGGALQTTLQMKEELRRKYGWPALE